MNSGEEGVNDEDDRSELFVRLLAENERQLAAYVMTFVPRAAEADDILQETKLGLWKTFSRFEQGTNFGAWARKAAFNRIMEFRRRKGREGRWLIFSGSTLELLAESFENDVDLRESRIMDLSKCIDKLPPEHRSIILLRYNESMTVDEVAERAGRSVGATYRVLSRIRLVLRDCVAGVRDVGDPRKEAGQ